MSVLPLKECATPGCKNKFLAHYVANKCPECEKKEKGSRSHRNHEVKRTVRDFKNFVGEETKTSSTGKFPMLSAGHGDFWRKLNKIGARNIEIIPPETVPDIDATVELSEEEWDSLEREFRAL